MIDTDLLVIGGGTGGPMAAIKAKEANPKLRVVLMEKANVKRSGAICMGMDGLNNAVIPGYATPEQYVKEITIANDGIVHQKAVMAYAQGSYPMIRYLDQLGVKFEKDGSGDYNVRKVHHMGTYVLPMPEGHHVKKILYRQLRRLRVAVHQPLHGDTPAEGGGRPHRGRDRRQHPHRRVPGDPRQGGDPGAAARPAGSACRPRAICSAPTRTPTNCGDGYAMAYHAGAELANLECFQINPLIKDYNGPACAYVTGPFGGYTANNQRRALHRVRLLERPDDAGVLPRAARAARARCSSSSIICADETISEIETILHTNERP